MSVSLEWAAVGPGEVIVADERRAWVHQTSELNFGDPFAEPMHGPGSEATTGKLLEGAIGLGLRAARAKATGAPPPLTLERWAWRLCGLYHLTTHTPALLSEAEARFRAAGRAELADWAEAKRIDERDHDRLALLDLEAMGYDAEATVARLRPPVALAMVAWFETAARAPLPLGVIAYAHTVERLALRFGQPYLDRVAALKPGVRITRCLKIHSGVGSDVRHVAENIALVARLPAAERARIVVACRQIAQLSSTPPREGYRSQSWLEDELVRVRRVDGPAHPPMGRGRSERNDHGVEE
ncbi:MAG: hypothetical protein KC620_05410 [Myxococcales bacterium]|nr:hypothetical protein [Myxococcales bacterium]